MLNVLKLFLESQDKYLNNKDKYKPLLYILTKINEKSFITIDRIEELLLKIDIENFAFTDDEINKEEYHNIEKMEINEILFKEIENTLMIRINEVFKQENIITKKY